MELEKQILEYASLNGYVKPEIKGEGYFFVWQKYSYGIPDNEITLFKTFIRDIIPIVSNVVVTVRQLRKLIGKTENLDDLQTIETFEPLIILDKDGTYRVSIGDDGIIFIDRRHHIESSLIDVEWQLGHLVLK